MGVLFSFYTQGTIVFRHKSVSAFLRFVLAWTLIYFINLAEIRLFMLSHLGAYVAGAIAPAPPPIASFLIQRWIVFQTAGGARTA